MKLAGKDGFPRDGGATPEALFRAVVAHHADAVDLEPKRGFGSRALKVDGKIFASLSKGRLLLKLPEGDVERLVASKQGERFSTGAARTKKEWVTIGPCDAATWIALSQRARTYVRDLPR
jgi:hypothetical protein